MTASITRKPHVAQVRVTGDGPRAHCSCGWVGEVDAAANSTKSPMQAEALDHARQANQ